MNKVNREAIKSLLESEDNATLSLYLPTHRFPTSEHIQEDKIRLKNLIRTGKEALEAQGVDDGIIAQMCSEIESGLYDNADFWQHTTEGLAVFCSPASVQYFHLPMECDERVSAGDGYDITPLLAVASYNSPYYLLAVAAHTPVLYRGDMYGVERVAIELPKSPEAALGIDEMFANSQTVRAGGGYGPGSPSSGSHGQGDSRQAGQEERLKFFRIIDDKIAEADDVDKTLPLLLAGTDDDISGYRESSRNKKLLKASLGGNYTEAPQHELHALAWPVIVEEVSHKERTEQLEKLNSLLGTGRASIEVSDIAKAAEEGRVDTLLVGMLTVTRDTISDTEDPATKLVFPRAYEADGLGACGRAVFNQGGNVLAVLQDTMPQSSSEAALYRY